MSEHQNKSTSNETRPPRNFIRAIVADDVAAGRHGGAVITRFPPEPNGYLHIGHAKSICLNFGLAQEFNGRCNLRFDDTNPETEDMHYVEAIQESVRWLGFDWGDNLYYASDYFQQLYDWAVQLVEAGKAYVDDLSYDEIRAYRGTITESGRPSPYRDRSVAENLDLLERMRAGEFPDGAKVLRARIDMAAPNMKMRDPLMYRIRHATHYRTGDDWCIYPFYDWAHGQSDAIEGVTHSICTLEFENNRELYDWYLDQLGIDPRPHQYEFARLNLDYTVMSKRKLLHLVESGYVSGWDDPRLSTIAGMRRRGYTPEAIRSFAEDVGVAKNNSRVEFGLLEYHVRSDLNHRAPRVLCVLDPLPVTLTNFPGEDVEWLESDYWPHDVPREGSRPLPFTRNLLIERSDFMEEPVQGFRRLAPGREVRLRHGYIIRCDGVIKNAAGEVVELRCSYDPSTRSGSGENRKVAGTLHWVSATESLPAEVRVYDRLFSVPNPEETGEGESFLDNLNPDSLTVMDRARIEPSVAQAEPGARYQFERQGYFVADSVDSGPGHLVFNRIVALRDTWEADKEKGASASARTASQSEEEEVVEGTSSAARDANRQSDPVLAERYALYAADYGLAEQDADLLAGDRSTSDFFTAAVAAYNAPAGIARIVTNLLYGRVEENEYDALLFGPAELAELAELIDTEAISFNIGKDLLEEMLRSGGSPGRMVEERGLAQISDRDALAEMIADVIAANPEKVAAYRSGKTGLRGFFMGRIMQASKGQANPQLVQELLEEALG
ncbi:MAG: glutamine--tRNA ligase/YqeY domain fusion protein [Caldilineaceae bacterium]|nr:glutamine--tRNA ligase/YqeY domain fusion protein [Caldilineaceae bacterium]